ncbi:FAD-dependent monooxygenase [Actinocrispum sp. NPDC049592]|uniref:FAD-dependent monooxygenase n=1 Tax=Actinocrispum sp. NPDC049592 TaxID=3154835 RepID=UPI003437CA10
MDVIVVGAGPVGLWLASELQLAGVSTVVLERAAERSPHTKALGMHVRTLEVLAMRGALDELLAAGIPVPAWHFGLLDRRVSFAGLDTPYPFMLAIPQLITEELLEKRALALGVRILREHEVTGISQDQDSVRVTVNSETVLTAAYVVGCDGAGSTVRKAAGIEFPGTASTAWGYLADVTLADPPQGPYTRHTPQGALIVAPLPGGLHRVTGFDPTSADRTELTLADVRASAFAVAGTDFGMRDPVWLSRFGNAARLASAYRNGRVLLAGDAAHMHMPTGGLGLNVGIQDAMNLGWKLAAVAQNRSPATLLDTYHAERHAVGSWLVENAQAQTALLTNYTPETQALRATLSTLIDRNPALEHDLAMQLSGLDVSYPANEGAHPLVGTRAPDLDGELFASMHDGRPLRVTTADKPYTDGMHVVYMSHTRPEWTDVATAEIRPDGYIAEVATK